MGIIPLVFNPLSVFSTIDAGTFLAEVEQILGDSSNGDAWDSGTIDIGAMYDFNFRLPDEGCVLEWELLKRQLSIVLSEIELSKIYDGNMDFIIGDSVYSAPVITYDEINNIYFAEITVTTTIQLTQTLIWTVSNIINGDQSEVNLEILSITSNKANTNAEVAIIDFGTFDSENYYVFVEEGGSLAFSVPCVIEPKPITMSYSELSHIYNGEGKIYEYGTNMSNRYRDITNIDIFGSLKTVKAWISRSRAVTISSVKWR
jgi:hypothetical protein